MKEIISSTLVASLLSLTFSSVLTENTGNDLTSLLHSNLETGGGAVEAGAGLQCPHLENGVGLGDLVQTGFNISWVTETPHPNLAHATYPPSQTTTPSAMTNSGLPRKADSKYHTPQTEHLSSMSIFVFCKGPSSVFSQLYFCSSLVRFRNI